jgi:diguanylate cyclase
LPGTTEMADSLIRPVVIEGLPLSVEGSIGVACAPQDADTIEELLRRADVAMYHAKRTGSGVERYAPDRDARTVHRLALTAEVRAAVRDGDLRLDYQPKVDLATGRVVGAEALVRWDHPERGPVPPAHFIPAVEATVLIGEFTLHVLDRAVRQAAEWDRAGIGLPIAANLSARTLLDPMLPANVRRLLTRHALRPDRLVLEVTETVAMSELDVVERVLHALHDLGVQLSVDDFGTGYSSLTFLSRTRLHELKIDRSFVAGMLESPGDAAIVRSAVELARSFDLRVVAEGIENDEECAALLRLGCRFGQGYLFGKPTAPAALERRLRDQLGERAPTMIGPGGRGAQLRRMPSGATSS